ncbi:mitochondrion protein, partial [Endogone sp. FLAS-F59071]
ARVLLPLTTSAHHTARPFHTSSPSHDATLPNHHFDTYKFVQKLEQDGFTREQAEAILDSLSEVIDESVANLTKNMVTKVDQEKTVYTYKVDFAQLKSEIQLLGKNDFTMMKTEHERLQSEIEKLRQKLREEITRTQAGVRLDLNLEKGRIRDEAGALEVKIRETDTKIESEIAGLRTQMEAIKFQILQYLIGTITGAGALVLAYLRMFR